MTWCAYSRGRHRCSQWQKGEAHAELECDAEPLWTIGPLIHFYHKHTQSGKGGKPGENVPRLLKESIGLGLQEAERGEDRDPDAKA